MLFVITCYNMNKDNMNKENNNLIVNHMNESQLIGFQLSQLLNNLKFFILSIHITG